MPESVFLSHCSYYYYIFFRHSFWWGTVFESLIYDMQGKDKGHFVGCVPMRRPLLLTIHHCSCAAFSPPPIPPPPPIRLLRSLVWPNSPNPLTPVQLESAMRLATFEFTVLTSPGTLLQSAHRIRAMKLQMGRMKTNWRTIRRSRSRFLLLGEKQKLQSDQNLG